MHRLSLFRTATLVVVLLVSVAGCPRRDPPQRLAKNLGTPDDPILPTATRTHDLAILTGRAAPIRAADVADDQADTDDTDTNGQEDQGPGAVSQEDRELIEELFDAGITALAEERIGDIKELVVPDQQEKLSALFEQVVKLSDASNRFSTQVREKAPQMAATMVGMSGLPGVDLGSSDGKLTPEQLAEFIKITEMRMTGDDKAVVRVDAMGQSFPVDLWLVEDEWYIHLPELLEDQELMDKLIEAGALMTGKMDDIAARLEDGSLAPEALMPELMRMGQQLMPIIAELTPKFQELMAASAGTDLDEESDGADEANDGTGEPAGDDDVD